MIGYMILKHLLELPEENMLEVVGGQLFTKDGGDVEKYIKSRSFQDGDEVMLVHASQLRHLMNEINNPIGFAA